MELGGNLLFYALGVPLALLFLAVLAQRFRISQLEKEIDQITLKFQVEAASPKEIRNELFASCPYPVCIVDTNGKILAKNQPFLRLAEKEIKTLSDFDSETRGTLRHLPLAGHRHSHRLLTIQNDLGGMRQFNVLAWPIWGPQVQLGSVLAFHEQTKVLQRKSYQLHFEQQLIAYIALLTTQLEEIIQPVQRGLELEREQATALLTGYTKEMRLLFSHLQEIQRELRQPNPHEVINVVKVAQEALREHKQTITKKELHLITTTPKEASALGHARDTSLAIHALNNAVFLHAERKATIRFNIYTKERQTILEYILPNQKLKPREIEQAFAFGVHGKEVTSMMRLWRLQLSVCRELLGKYNGQLRISSEEETGTVYQLILVSAPKE